MGTIMALLHVEGNRLIAQILLHSLISELQVLGVPMGGSHAPGIRCITLWYITFIMSLFQQELCNIIFLLGFSVQCLRQQHATNRNIRPYCNAVANFLIFLTSNLRNNFPGFSEKNSVILFKFSHSFPLSYKRSLFHLRCSKGFKAFTYLSSYLSVWSHRSTFGQLDAIKRILNICTSLTSIFVPI